MTKFNVSHELRAIIRAMMNPDPKQRPSVNELINHPKLTSIRRQRRMERFSLKCVSSSYFLIFKNFDIQF